MPIVLDIYSQTLQVIAVTPVEDLVKLGIYGP
jgi:hypothetical protein